MSEVKLLFLQGEESLHTETSELKKNNKTTLLFSTKDTFEAMRFLKENPINAVLVELQSPTTLQFEFIDQLSLLSRKPAIAVISNLQEESYYTRARRLGANLVYRAPYNLVNVLDDLTVEVQGLKPQVNVKIMSDKILDERLSNIFIASGIPPHIKGYQFLRDAVKLAVQTPSLINNITKQLYPAIADKYITSPSKVERAIRHAIEVAWSRGKIDNINSIYGIKVFSKGEKPTNGELIALISDRMIIECM